jgi:hypothetical protein
MALQVKPRPVGRRGHADDLSVNPQWQQAGNWRRNAQIDAVTPTIESACKNKPYLLPKTITNVDRRTGHKIYISKYIKERNKANYRHFRIGPMDRPPTGG